METLATRLALEPFVANEFGDCYLESVNQSVFRHVGYEEYLREHFGYPPFQEGKLYVVTGTDSGLLISYLQKFGLPARTSFLLVELPEVLERIRNEISLGDLVPRLVVTTSDRISEALEPLHFSEYSRLNQVVLLKSFGAMDGHLPGYVELFAAIRGDVYSRNWLVKAKLGSQWFMMKRLENLGENRISLTCLEGRFQGKTAIVLGGGPSLDEVLPWVRENRHHLVVLSVGRISGRLRSVGITPDFIVSIDPHLSSFDNSRDTLSFWQEAALIHSASITPYLLGQWRGRSFYGGQRFDWETPLNDKSWSPYSPTVTNFAVAVGAKMGFRRILLAGVDFCFTQSGVTHAQGSHEHSMGAVIGQNLTVETNAGTQAESIEDFIIARDAMGKLAQKAKVGGCEVINLAPGAARMDGIAHQLPEQIEFRSDEVNSTVEVMASLPVEDEASRMLHYQTVLAELSRARESLTKIDTLFKVAKAWKAEDRLTSVKKALDDEQLVFYRTVNEFGSRDFMLAYAAADLENMSEAEYGRVMKLFFAAFADSAGKLKELIENSEQRVRIRLLEEQETPDFAALATQWRSDGQPGRILLWEGRFPGKVPELTGRYAELVKGLRDDYAGMMAEGFTLVPVKEKTFKIDDTLKIILELFTKKDQGGLVRVAQALLAYRNQDGDLFSALSLAQAKELAGTDAEARADYEKIVAAGATPILELALSRIAALAIKASDLPALLEVMEQLSRLSPAYEPRYAEALAAAGEHERALDVYADYLDKKPTDIAIMLRLGRYYQQLNHPDGARFILGQVLELEPGNRTAATLLEQLV